MIEDILFKAEKLGIRKEVLATVESRLKINPNAEISLVYENVFNELTKQTKQS